MFLVLNFLRCNTKNKKQKANNTKARKMFIMLASFIVHVLTRKTYTQKKRKLFIMFIDLRFYVLKRNANNKKARKLFIVFIDLRV